MVTWQEIGLENFQTARALYQSQRYRSSVSRAYYAAFSVLTHTLNAHGVYFGEQQETPNHKGLSLAADYQRRTTDAMTARDAMRDAAALFRLVGWGMSDQEQCVIDG